MGTRIHGAIIPRMAQDTVMMFADATSKITAGDIDYLHLSREGHRELSKLVYQKLQTMLEI